MGRIYPSSSSRRRPGSHPSGFTHRRDSGLRQDDRLRKVRFPTRFGQSSSVWSGWPESTDSGHRLLLLNGPAMANDEPAIPKRFDIARRWQWPAVVASILFILSCFIGWPFSLFWPSAIGLVLFIPAVALLSIKCHACGYSAFADYQAGDRLRLDDRFWPRFWGKEYGGVHLPLRSACSKCGAHFVDDGD